MDLVFKSCFSGSDKLKNSKVDRKQEKTKIDTGDSGVFIRNLSFNENVDVLQEVYDVFGG